MSVKIMGQVWELELPHQETLVLLAMADHADHEGKHVRPSLDLLAWKTGYSKRQIIRIMQALETKRLIRVHKGGGGRGRATEYTLSLQNGVKKSPFRNSDTMTPNSEEEPVDKRHIETNSDIKNSDTMTLFSKKGDTVTPFSGVTTEKTVTFATQNSDICDGDYIDARAEPSLEPKTKRESRARARTPPPSKPRPSKHVPDDFALTAAMTDWATKEVPGVNIEYETKKFRDWEFKDAHSDWPKAWRSWMRRAWEKLPAAEQRVTATHPRAIKVVL